MNSPTAEAASPDPLTPGEAVPTSPEAAATPTGRLLSGTELRETLGTADKVFHGDSWSPDKIMGAGYHARLAGSPLVMPSESSYVAVSESETPLDRIVLQPGQSAVVSTVECFSLDLDIAATIGQQFRLAAQGLLVLHGSAIHPGYGRSLQKGEWLPDENVRLYFVVANIGPREIELRCVDDAIVYLQFWKVDRDPQHQMVRSRGFDRLKQELYGPNKERFGLSFFRTVEELRDGLAQLSSAQDDNVRAMTSLVDLQAQKLDAESKRIEAVVDGRLQTLNERVESAVSAADKATNASNYVVVFGVFLVAASIFGVTLDAIAGAIEKVADIPLDWKSLVIVALSVMYAGAIVFSVRAVASAVKGAKGESA